MTQDPHTLGELLTARADARPSTVFVRCGDESRTYEEAFESSRRLAAGLALAGIGSGDRVAVLLPNRIEFVDAILALGMLGAVQVPLNVFLKGEFLLHQLRDCGASMLVVDTLGLQAAAPLLGQLPRLTHLVITGDDPLPAPRDGVTCLRYHEIVGSGSKVPSPSSSSSDLAAILYTSGTTGLPKGCMVSHGYYHHAGRRFAEILETTREDVILSALPLFHMGGQGFVLMQALVAGATAAIEPAFSASAYILRAEAVGATLTIGAGPMAMAIMATPASPNDRNHRLRLGQFGPLSAAQQLSFEERFGFEVLSETYAQTECSPASLTTRSALRKRDTAGRPAPWLELKVVDDQDIEVPAGAVGEIVIRPLRPDVMFQGYWENPLATLKTFRNLWHHTGDLGRMDPDGFLTFVDRKTDSVRRRGENVSAFELERTLVTHPKIAEVAVHAVPSPLGEDDIKACIVPAEGEAISPDDLFDFCRHTLPYFAVPRYVDLLDQLPKNAFGRVMKQYLREAGNTSATWDFETLGLIIDPSERRSGTRHP